MHSHSKGTKCALADPAAAREARYKRLDAIDDDDSGYIEAPELHRALKVEGIHLPLDWITELIKCADSNSDGKRSYDEFKSARAKARIARRPNYNTPCRACCTVHRKH